MSDHMTPGDFAEHYGIRLEVIEGPTRGTDNGWEHNAYTLRLSYAQDFGENTSRHSIDVPWHQGLAFDGAPEIGDVLGNLAGTLRDRDTSWEDFAGDYGYDEDSRRAHGIWEHHTALGRQVAEWAEHWPGMVGDFEIVEDL